MNRAAYVCDECVHDSSLWTHSNVSTSAIIHHLRLLTLYTDGGIGRLHHRTGDIKKMKPPLTAFRLRCGDYRVFFDLKGDNTIEISAVRHRKEAYQSHAGTQEARYLLRRTATTFPHGGQHAENPGAE